MDSKRMTANQLQNYVGVDQSTISRIINGKTKNPSLDTLQQIAKFFGYNAADLMNVDLRTGQSVKEGLNDIAHYEIKERLKLGFHDKSELVRIPYLDAAYRDWETDRKSTRLNSSHSAKSRMPSSA